MLLNAKTDILKFLKFWTLSDSQQIVALSTILHLNTVTQTKHHLTSPWMMNHLSLQLSLPEISRLLSLVLNKETSLNAFIPSPSTAFRLNV